MADKVYLNEAEAIADERDQRRNDPNRGSILPFRKTDEGELEWALPQWMEDLYNSFTLPSDTLKGYNPTYQDTTEFGMNVGGSGAATSKAVAPDADVGMFLGSLSKKADQRSLERATEMLNNGYSREEVWAKEGWYQGPDGHWKYEIPDDGLKTAVDEDPTFWNDPNGQQIEGDIRGVMSHPELKEAYPKGWIVPSIMEDGKATIGRIPDEDNRNVFGSFSGYNNELKANGKDKNAAFGVILHELQHKVQKSEGFSAGSSPNSTKSIKQTAYSALPKEAKEYLEIKKNTDELARALEVEDSIKADISSPEGWGQTGESMDPETKIKTIQDFKENTKRLSELRDVLHPIWKDFSPLIDFLSADDFKNYKRNMGEVEAENTRKRAMMTPEQRAKTPPWKTQDFPDEEQWHEEDINRYLDDLYNTLEGQKNGR